MATPAFSAYPDYPHIDAALKKFETYVDELPYQLPYQLPLQDNILPRRPIEGVFVNSIEFKDIADVMRQLPVCPGRQHAADVLQQQIEGLKDRYQKCLQTCVEKGIRSSKDVQPILTNMFKDSPIPNSYDFSDFNNNSQPAKQAQKSAVTRNSAGSRQPNKGFFALKEDTQGALPKQAAPGLFAAFRKALTM